MEFISIIDAHGKHWVLNKAFILGMSPTFGGGEWERGAQLLMDQQAFGAASITIKGEDVMNIRLALGAAM